MKCSVQWREPTVARSCEVFRAMFADQRAANEKKGKGHEHDKAAPLVLPDVRPAGAMPAPPPRPSCAAVFLAVLEFIYSNSCKLNQGIVRTFAGARPAPHAGRWWMCWRPASSTGSTA